MSELNIFSYVRNKRNTYVSQEIELAEGASFNQYETLRRVELYANNEYVNNAYDSILGKLPFDNITNYRVRLEARATDFDTKHFEIRPRSGSKEARVKSMVATKALKKYMDEKEFGFFLDDLTFTRAKYGGAMVKNSKDGLHVVPWHNLITDVSDIERGVIIERHYFTPSEMKGMKEWENTDDAIRTAVSFMDNSVRGDDNNDTQGEFIEVFEMHGDIPLSLYNSVKDEDYEYDPEDDYEYVRAMIVICGLDWKNDDNDDAEHGIVLFCEEETEDVYRYIARNKINGRGLGVGIIEELFEPQRWHNFARSERLRSMAISGKKLYITDDPDIAHNIHNNKVDHGTVLRKGQGSEFTELNQHATGFSEYQIIEQDLDASANKITSSFNAKIGEESKSGTPFRAQFLQNVEASSQFEQYREEIGLFLEKLITDWVLKTAISAALKEEELYVNFEPKELAMVDKVITAKAINRKVAEKTIKGEIVTPEDMQALQADLATEMSSLGNKRSISEFKKYLKDVDGFIKVITTDESRNKAVLFESLSNAIALLAPEDPRRDALIDRIMDEIGIPQEEIALKAGAPSNPNPQLENEELKKSTQVGAVLPLTK